MNGYFKTQKHFSICNFHTKLQYFCLCSLLQVKLTKNALERFSNMEISWISFVMIVLASYRLTHLIVFDKITEFIRNPFLTKKKNSPNESKKVPKSKIGYLLTCYWCAGIWCATFLAVVYLLIPDMAKYLIFILAIAGGQAILESFVGVNVKRTALYSEETKELK